MKVAVGSYVGNGLDDHAVAGVGFAPGVVLVKSGDGASMIIGHQDMAAGQSVALAANLGPETDCVKSLDADGFTVGTDTKVNQSGQTYHYLALADNGAGDIKLGTYTGNGSDNRDIAGVGFQPDLVLIRSLSTYMGCWRTSDVAGDVTALFDSVADSANLIQALNGDGFQIGSSGTVNGNGIGYVYLAATKGPLTAGGVYTGDGTDDRNITGVGFQPNAAWVKGRTGTRYGLSRPSTQAGDWTHYFAGSAKAANNIQALLADGFQVGSGTYANAATVVYRWWAWKAGTTGGPQEKTASDALAVGENLGDRTLGALDAAAVGDSVGSRALGAGEAIALGETQALAQPVAGADSVAIAESALVTLQKAGADALGLGDAAVATTSGKLYDRVEITATIVPGINDRVELRATIFRDRIADAVELDVAIRPLVVDRVQLEAAVRNQALEAAAEAAVIAPDADVSWL